jgi:hypothetical protein
MLVDMNSPSDPFDVAPTSPPVSTDPPLIPSSTPPGPRRGRMVMGAVAVVGLLGAGVFGVSQLAGADQSAAVGATDDTVDQPTGDTGEDTAEDTGEDTAEDAGDDSGEDTADQPADETAESDDTAGDDGVDGEITIDTGDGDPIVIDLGELDRSLEEFQECTGLPDLGSRLDAGPWADGRLDEVFGDLGGSLEEWFSEIEDDLQVPDLSGGDVTFGADGNQITVLGPDGVTVIDLGEGDSSVTITQEDGEIDISTDGDATVQDLSSIFEELDTGEFELPPLEDLQELIPEDLFEQLPDLGELPFDLPDPDVIEECLAELD